MSAKKKSKKKAAQKTKTSKKKVKKNISKKRAQSVSKTKSLKPLKKKAKKVSSKQTKQVWRKIKSSASAPLSGRDVYVNPHIFREYDIRGIVADDLSTDVVELLGRSYATYMIDKGAQTVTVGRDVRTTSLSLKNALVKGMLSTGLNVIDVGEVPTPVLYYSILFFEMDGGIMVTGSHNPREYNGFKMCLGLAPIYGEEILKLKSIIDAKAFRSGAGNYREKTIVAQYLKMITSKIHFDKPFKIVIDAGNGTAGTIAPKIFRKLGCKVIELYCEPDGTFPNHLPDPTKLEYIVDLQKLVHQHKADIGLGFDGDSDRVGAIDEKGRVIWADKLMALFAREINKKTPGSKILFDVKCSQALIEDIQTHGGVPVMWKTGHSLLKAKMKELHNPLAGEMSGHIFFADDFYGYDDAIYVACRLVQLLSRSSQTLSELADSIPHFYSTPEIRVDTTEEDKFKIVEEVKAHFRSKYDIIDVDGVRVLYGDGWGLVRASNTQPVLVVRFEAKSESRLHEIMHEIISKLREYPSVTIQENDLRMY